MSEVFDLRFALPSECADQLASGEADIGIVPVIEMARQKLEYFRARASPAMARCAASC